MSTEIPIWVNGEIRWLSGIDKRTTCKDIVEVLLDEEGISKSDVKDFTIMERWRKVERPLDENSKILKIWSHWGYEKREVRLCLRRIDNEVDSGRGSPIGSGSTPSLRRKRNRFRANGKPPWIHPEALHPSRLAELGKFSRRECNDEYNEDSLNQNYPCEKREINCEEIYGINEGVNCRKKSTQKSYQCPGTGKLHSTLISDYNNPRNQTKRTGKCCSKRESKQKMRNSENIQKLMKLILAQGATIQSQLQKLKERDEQIESIEQERHRERIEKNGRNYLLETYLGSLKDAEIPAEMDEERADDSGVNTEGGGSDQMNAMRERNKERIVRNETELDSDGNEKIFGHHLGHQGKVHHHHPQDSTSQCHPSSKVGSCQKSARSKSESRTHESKFAELNLKRTLSDNSLAKAGACTKSNDDNNADDNEDGEKRVQSEGNLNTKEESDEVIELKKIQSQIQMWEKVFKINKKLEKEEENLVRLHIKVKKYQIENYRFAKEKCEETNEKELCPSGTVQCRNDEDQLLLHLLLQNGNDNPDGIDREQNYSKIQKNLEILKSDLEQNSKEIYRNFTKLLEEDERVERKRISLSKLLSDLEKTEFEGETLKEMMMMMTARENQWASNDRPLIFHPKESAAAKGQGSLVENEMGKVPEMKEFPPPPCLSEPGGPEEDLRFSKPQESPQNGRIKFTDQNLERQEDDSAPGNLQRESSLTKPKMVKISFEDEIRRCESSEGSQEKSMKEPVVPVAAGALKGILKNRKKSISNQLDSESQKLNGESQIRSQIKFQPVCEPKNHYSSPNTNGLPTSDPFRSNCDVPEPINFNYSNMVLGHGQNLQESNPIYFSPPQFPSDYDLKTGYPSLRSSQLLRGEIPIQKPHSNVFPQTAMVVTKTKVATVLNDNDSSTSSDTSGLCSMYSSSPSVVEQPYIEHGYILDTLV